MMDWPVYLAECLAESERGDLAHRHVERLCGEVRLRGAELRAAKCQNAKLKEFIVRNPPAGIIK